MHEPVTESHLRQCTQTCNYCHAVCEQTLHYCLHKGGRLLQGDCVQALIDCSQICQLTQDLTLRQSPLQEHTRGLCAEACHLCAQTCQQFQEDAQMHACANMCQQCATACQ
ncbi:four-helix bundle copper-binding protein [Ktedonobacter robiniae]|uniref:Four-helix bundle copper-binding protein n=1 Tax=Ktedonobacter robiniae TaxID=2778365 RepID=A0ABQ3V2L3_9CHLR|nr:four-helix bundle copper-binding protein [Ktedonobacter robiniae]GHO59130.1 hypothetical protein KSB_76050 [Ktedonobacter robiniae]